MAAGKRYKWQGSTIEVMTGYLGGSPLRSISNVTKANPAVVTSTAHGLVEGDLIKISEVVGMDELNDELFIVQNVTSNTFELFNINSTGYTTYTSGGKIDTAVMSAMCELTGYNRQGGSSPEIAATTICSDSTEYEVGLPDFGTTQLDFNFAPATGVQSALHTFHQSGDKLAVRVTLPRSGGEFIQLGFVQQESESAANGGLWTAQVTIRNTGERFDIGI